MKCKKKKGNKMYLFKPFKTQDECDRALDKLLTHFSSDRDRIKIATFLGRIEVTKQYMKDKENKTIEYETRKDMFMDKPINKEE